MFSICFFKRKSILLTMSLLLLPILVNAQECNLKVPTNSPTGRFVSKTDGTVVDAYTGLVWKKCSEGQSFISGGCNGTPAQYTWGAALAQAEAVNASVNGFAKQYDWRVPNIKELSSIIEWRCNYPAVKESVFPLTVSDYYWSSTPDIGFIDNFNHKGAWIVSFTYGGSGTGEKSSQFRLRLVRGGS